MTMALHKKPSRSRKPAVETVAEPDAAAIQEETVPVAQNTDEVAQTAERLLNECSEVRLRVNWFTTSAKIDKKTATDMLRDTGAETSAVSMSKRIMSRTHESVQAAENAKKLIMEHRDAWTVPMLALRMSGGNAQEDMRKDAGVRLIQKKDMEQFDHRLHFLIGVLRTAIEKLQTDLNEVKEVDKKALGNLFDEADYPTDIVNQVGVEVSYRNVGVDLDWANMCPEIYKREQINAREKFGAVVEGAAYGFTKDFVEYIEQAVHQLGCRVMLNPLPAYRKLRVALPKKTPKEEIETGKTVSEEGADLWQQEVDVTSAELLQQVKHEDSPDDVPEGSVLIKLRLDNSGVGRSTEVWAAAPMTEQELQDRYRPYENTSKPRKVYASTIDNMKERMAAFLNIGAMLGPYEKIINASVAKVRELLTSASREQNTEIIAKEMRDSTYMRSTMRRTLRSVVDDLQASMKDVVKKRRSLRD